MFAHRLFISVVSLVVGIHIMTSSRRAVIFPGNTASSARFIVYCKRIFGLWYIDCYFAKVPYLEGTKILWVCIWVRIRDTSRRCG